jgi:hypothetical protein
MTAIPVASARNQIAPVSGVRTLALGPIFRTVRWHSLAGAAVIGIIAMLQAYVFPGMIPVPPLK